MTKILITGKDSFVGKNYIRFSEYKEIDEISMFENRPEDIRFEGYDVVIHLVAIVHQSRKIRESEYIRVNRDLCVRSANCAKAAGVKQFIFLSTVKVYGKFKRGSLPWTEYSDCFPEDSYGKSKREAEKLIMKLCDENFIVSIIRTPLVYGDGVQANMYSLLKLVSRFSILPFKDIDNRRSFTAVENLAAFIDRIIQMRIPGIFIAKDQDSKSTTELVRMISRFFGKRVTLIKIPHFVIRIGMFIYPRIFDRLFGSYEMDNASTLQKLDFTPPNTTEHCIEKMVIAFQKNKPQ